MDSSSHYLKRFPQDIRLRSSVWSAIASVFLLTEHASSLGNEHQTWRVEATDSHFVGSSVVVKSAFLPTVDALTDASRQVPGFSLPVGTRSLAARFAEPLADVNNPLPVAASTPAVALSKPLIPAVGLTDDEDAKRRRAAYSAIGVFSLADTATVTSAALGGDSPQPSHTAAPRSDLLDGVPEAYAALVARIAAEEEVDPNWVLAVMRAENAGFDRQLASPAGAIGLMQVMPQIGTAFGATDLTDPEQNIRAGTRFLHRLIGEYRNPVLIASAYNAGEPSVDANHSLPLIQETADYVTRVVGYYTGMPAAVPTAHMGIQPQASASPATHRDRAERAKSPMLVFSVAEPSAALGPAPREPGPLAAGGPVKIVKEEVIP